MDAAFLSDLFSKASSAVVECLYQMRVLMINESVLIFFDPLPAETYRHAAVCDEDCLPKDWEFSVDFLLIQVWFIRITSPY